MPRQPYDPLAVIPSPEALRERLAATLDLAERLRLLLDFAERLHLPMTTADKLPMPSKSPDLVSGQTATRTPHTPGRRPGVGHG